MIYFHILLCRCLIGSIVSWDQEQTHVCNLSLSLFSSSLKILHNDHVYSPRPTDPGSILLPVSIRLWVLFFKTTTSSTVCAGFYLSVFHLPCRGHTLKGLSGVVNCLGKLKKTLLCQCYRLNSHQCGKYIQFLRVY